MTKEEFEAIPWGQYFWGEKKELGYNLEIGLFRKPIIYGEPKKYDYCLEVMGSEVNQRYQIVRLIKAIDKPI